MELSKRKRKAGRPKVKDKVKLLSLYLRTSERKKIEKKFGGVAAAIREIVLPQCG